MGFLGILGGIVGGVAGFAIGGPAGAAIGAGLGSQAGAAGEGSGDQKEGLEAQAYASIEAAKVNAQGARDVANAQLQGTKMQTDAAIKASQNSALGGIVGAALGAHTTSEVIKQWLPVETGAQTIQSWELATRWNKTLQMKQEGYQDVAIDYELSGKSGSALYKSPEWNALKMMEMTKNDSLAAAQMFGVQSANNPNGVALSWEDYKALNSYKRPEDIMTVDPQVKAMRQAQFANWENQMRASGKGLLVDIYKNPQLGGASIEGLKGKDPLIDPALAPLIQQMGNTQGTPGVDAYYTRDDGTGGKTNTPQPGWHLVTPAIPGTKGTNFDMSALTSPTTGPRYDEVKWAEGIGLIDKYGMIDAGVLLSQIPKELQNAPEFNVLRDLSQQDLIRLQDQYNGLMNKVVDPKLIRDENQGFGVIKKVLLNADGSRANSVLIGNMQDAMGNTHEVMMSGERLQEWYDRQSMIDGMGPTFPGMFAPRSNDEVNGVRQVANGFATPNRGTPGQPGLGGGATKQQTPAPKMASQFAENPYAQQMQLGGPERTPGALSSPTAPKPASGSTTNAGSNPAASAGGASLAPGGD